MWHVSDELGNHNGSCDCDVSAAHFREWLRDKHGHVDVVNRAWRTDYWSQHYSNFPEIGTPAASTGFGNPGQLLDWRRFCSDALLEVYLAEKAVLREITPSIPVTTNFLVGTDSGEIGPGDCDDARWPSRTSCPTTTI